MSDLSTTHASAAGLLPGLRTGGANNPHGTPPGLSGEGPNFSAVLKERSDKLAKPDGTPAENAGKIREGHDKTADSGESANAAADAASSADNKERSARAEKRNDSSAEKKSDDATEQDATAATAQTPIAAVMVQMTPAALVTANADALEGDVIADSKSPFGAVVRELARGHGQGDKNDAGNHGLSLAVGQGAGKAGIDMTNTGDAGQTGDQPAQNGQPQLTTGTEGELAATADATVTTDTADAQETPPLVSGSADDNAELTASTSTSTSAKADSDFNQLLTQVREGHNGGQATTGSVNRTGGSEAAMAMRAPVGHPNWSNELGDKMTWMVTNQRQQADLVLNPPQLGRIEVSLTIKGDEASAVFASPNAAVREMLENSLPRLREILAGSGLNLGQADVGAQAFAQHQQAREGERHAGGLRGESPVGIDTAINAGGSLNLGRAGERRGMVDIFA